MEEWPGRRREALRENVMEGSRKRERDREREPGSENLIERNRGEVKEES